jgi:hypothetical protein
MKMKLRNNDLRDVVITVSLPRVFRLRIALGLALVKLGCRVVGVTYMESREP